MHATSSCSFRHTKFFVVEVEVLVDGVADFADDVVLDHLLRGSVGVLVGSLPTPLEALLECTLQDPV